MNRNSTGLMALFVLLGMLVGLALAVLLQSGSAAAQASGEPTPGAPGTILPGGVVAPPGNAAVKVEPPTASQPGAALQPGFASQPSAASPAGSILEPGASSSSEAFSPAGPAALSALAGKAFTYQGVLRQGGQPVNGSCDLQFALWDDLAAGTQQGTTQTITAAIANGLFTVLLNDAGQFSTALDGRALWIETGVRCPSGGGNYSVLSPRQALTAAPLAATLAPHGIINADDTFSGFSTLAIQAPAVSWANPMALKVSGGSPSNYIGTFNPAGVWGDSASGTGVWGTTNTGYAVIGSSAGSGWAGYFEGNVTVTGKLNVPRFHTTQVINSVGPLPITSGSFTTSGGTLILFFSGSGFTNTPQVGIGMNIYLDGNLVDTTGVFANLNGVHLAFVAKQWVLTGIAAGNHTISLQVRNGNTSTDFNDIFEVVVTEMPY